MQDTISASFRKPANPKLCHYIQVLDTVIELLLYQKLEEHRMQEM